MLSYILSQWSNALCEKRKQLDVLSVSACRDEKLVGLGGCSTNCGTMWQIGADMLTEERRKGIVSMIASRLALVTLQREKVPFY